MRDEAICSSTCNGLDARLGSVEEPRTLYCFALVESFVVCRLDFPIDDDLRLSSSDLKCRWRNLSIFPTRRKAWFSRGTVYNVQPCLPWIREMDWLVLGSSSQPRRISSQLGSWIAISPAFSGFHSRFSTNAQGVNATGAQNLSEVSSKGRTSFDQTRDKFQTLERSLLWHYHGILLASQMLWL